MLRLVQKSCKPMRSIVGVKNSTKMFSSNKGIPSDEEQQAGRRKVEIEEAKHGRAAYNQDAVVPESNQGTKENPIMVPSGLSVRAVGFEDPNTHQLQWFNLSRGHVHYIPTIGLYFKMLVLE